MTPGQLQELEAIRARVAAEAFHVVGISDVARANQTQADRRLLLDWVDKLGAEQLRLLSLLSEQNAKVNAVYDLMQRYPFSQGIPQVDLVGALTGLS
jgi:ureidoglycolate hydrolase